MYYRKMNQVSCLFDLPIPLYNYMVQDIDTESNDFTVVYMDSGWVLEISGIR